MSRELGGFQGLLGGGFRHFHTAAPLESPNFETTAAAGESLFPRLRGWPSRMR